MAQCFLVRQGVVRVPPPPIYIIDFACDVYGGFSCEQGMTWETYISSDYNPLIDSTNKRFILDDNNVLVGHLNGSSVYYDEYVYYNDARVSKTDIITEQTYNVVCEGIEFDYISNTNVNEVDLLYTTDTHLSWTPYTAYTSPQKWTPQDIKDYKDNLWSSGIPTFAVDCGDFDHGKNAPFSTIVDLFNNFGSVGYNKYLSVTMGNHEWYTAMGSTASACLSYINQVDSMSACNFLKDGSHVYKPYRAVKIGQYKIGVIAVAYPSPNGRNSSSLPHNSDVHTWDGYTWYDATRNTPYANQPSSALYVEMQRIIDIFKSKHFDWIFVNAHVDYSVKESLSADSRFNTRAEYLIQNTNGIDGVIMGHLNDEDNNAYTFSHNDGVGSGKLLQNAQASLGSFGRIRINLPSKSYTSELIKS